VTFRPLVYNGSVLARLDDRGASPVEVPSQIPAGSTVALRPHGTLADDRTAIEARGAKVLDLTCPHVMAVRDLVVRAREAGRRVVIAGNREHDEVLFLAEAAGSNHRIVASADEAEALVLDAPPALVAQSTLGGAIYEDIAEILKSRYPGTVTLNTLCGASDERFEEARALAEEADVVVVVGPYNSGSTRRIAELVRESGKQTFQVELPEDLQVSSLVDQARLARRDAILRDHADDPEALRRASAGPEVLDEDVVIGVTAGAATAPWTVRAIVDRLLEATGAALLQGEPKDLAAEAAGVTVAVPVAPDGLALVVDDSAAGGKPVAAPEAAPDAGKS
jgi:4-hydroxy-3-methylbut-2-enyl diphosphate reductase